MVLTVLRILCGPWVSTDCSYLESSISLCGYPILIPLIHWCCVVSGDLHISRKYYTYKSKNSFIKIQRWQGVVCRQRQGWFYYEGTGRGWMHESIIKDVGRVYTCYYGIVVREAIRWKLPPHSVFLLPATALSILLCTVYFLYTVVTIPYLWRKTETRSYWEFPRVQICQSMA